MLDGLHMISRALGSVPGSSVQARQVITAATEFTWTVNTSAMKRTPHYSGKLPVTLLMLILPLSGCFSSGPMQVYERSYLAVPSGDNTNFFRTTVEGNTHLGDSNYDSGWFPADTVDKLYGSTSRTDSAQALKTKEDIRALMDEAILATTKGYLRAAQDPSSSEESIVAWLTAQRRVRAMAGDGIPLPDGAVEVEYDPSRSLALRHSGEKRVFVLASNPTEVIETISNFAGSAQTSATILRIADVVSQRRINDVDRVEARNEFKEQASNIIVSHIDGVLLAIEGGLDKDELLAEIDALLLLIEGSQ